MSGVFEVKILKRVSMEAYLEMSGLFVVPSLLLSLHMIAARQTHDHLTSPAKADAWKVVGLVGQTNPMWWKEKNYATTNTRVYSGLYQLDN